MNYTQLIFKRMFAFEVLTLHQNILLNSATVVVEEFATNHIFIMVEDLLNIIAHTQKD